MASQAKKPVKGILKKAKPTPDSQVEETAPTTTQTNKVDPRAIAIQHARLLQERKDIEALIFDHIVTLLDLPVHPTEPASAPHPSDVEAFLSRVRIFQPSDYDDLITERNLNENRCGYALCPNKRRQYKSAGTYKLVNKGRKNFDIVETKELEKWCSTECTRRALWVKVQLNETAAWERVGLPELKLDLYPEKEKEKGKEADVSALTSGSREVQDQRDSQIEPDRVAADMANLQLEQDRTRARDNVALALERGDDAKAESTRSVDVVIRERRVTTEAEAPSLSDDTIEGYRSKFGRDPENDPGDDPESRDIIAI